MQLVLSYMCFILKYTKAYHSACRIPEKEVITGIIKQGANCLESQGPDTAGNILAGVGVCKGTASNALAAQVTEK